jgi:hypothetical protein
VKKQLSLFLAPRAQTLARVEVTFVTEPGDDAAIATVSAGMERRTVRKDNPAPRFQFLR